MTPPTQNTGAASRWLELDGVRGLAALLVVYVHLFLRWVPPSPAPVFWMRTLSGMAWTGVDLFFILSGFLIGGILLRNRPAANYFQVFFLRRAFRILPLYFALLAAVFAIRLCLPAGSHESFAPGQIPYWTYPLLVQNFSMALTGEWGSFPLGVTWSVALEEQFYLFLPLLIRWVPPRAHLGLFAILAASAPLFRWLIPVPAPMFLLPGLFEPFFGGVILAWVFQNRPAALTSTRVRNLALFLFAAGGFGMACLAAGKGNFGVFRETVVTVFWGSFLWLVLSFMGSRYTAPLRWKPLCWVGGISYGVYLLHPLLSQLAFLAVFGAPPSETQGAAGFLLTCAATAGILGTAALSARCFERPLTALGHRHVYQRALPQPAPAGSGQ